MITKILKSFRNLNKTETIISYVSYVIIRQLKHVLYYWPKRERNWRGSYIFSHLRYFTSILINYNYNIAANVIGVGGFANENVSQAHYYTYERPRVTFPRREVVTGIAMALPEENLVYRRSRYIYIHEI